MRTRAEGMFLTPGKTVRISRMLKFEDGEEGSERAS